VTNHSASGVATPYTIRLDHRPIRFAFLFDSAKNGDAELNAAMTFAAAMVGGRYSPMIVTDGKDLAAADWNLLEVVDPDRIVSFAELEGPLLEKLNQRLTPLEILQPDHEGTRRTPRYLLGPPGPRVTPLVPSLETLRAAQGGFWNPLFADIALDEATPTDVRAFVEQSMGVFPTEERFTQVLTALPRQQVAISSYETLGATLEALSDHRSFFYPIQFSSAYGRLRGYERQDRLSDLFVVIGDSLQDRVAAWNLLLAQRDRKGGMAVVWIPKSLCDRGALQEPLAKWLTKLADPGGQTNKGVRFWSPTLGDEDVKDIARRLVTRWCYSIDTPNSWRPTLPEVGRRRHLELRQEDTVVRASSEEEHVAVGGPPYLIASGGPWMADVFIQYRPDMYSNFVGRSFWWLFPQSASLLHHIFGGIPKRVTIERVPSVEVSAESRVSSKVPNEDTALAYVILGDDVRDGESWTKASGLVTAYPSNVGRYLDGMLSTFGGLFNAGHTLQERYWRTMVQRLGGRRTTEGPRHEAFRNKISKALDRYDRNENRERFIDHLMGTALQLAREEARARRELPFAKFEDAACEELAAFNETHHPSDPWEFSPSDVKDAISYLMEHGVLVAGVRRMCPACGSANWHSADEVGDRLSCAGCGSHYALRAEETRGNLVLSPKWAGGCCVQCTWAGARRSRAQSAARPVSRLLRLCSANGTDRRAGWRGNAGG
jgi:hypothetical protein